MVWCNYFTSFAYNSQHTTTPPPAFLFSLHPPLPLSHPPGIFSAGSHWTCPVVPHGVKICLFCGFSVFVTLFLLRLLLCAIRKPPKHRTSWYNGSPSERHSPQMGWTPSWGLNGVAGGCPAGQGHCCGIVAEHCEGWEPTGGWLRVFFLHLSQWGLTCGGIHSPESERVRGGFTHVLSDKRLIWSQSLWL